MTVSIDDVDSEVLELFSAERILIDPASVLDPDEPLMRPMRRLWGMSFLQAVLDYLSGSTNSRAFREAKAWIFYGDAHAANSFDNVARFLEFDPQRVRAALTGRRSELWTDPHQALAVITAVRSAADDLGNAA